MRKLFCIGWILVAVSLAAGQLGDVCVGSSAQDRYGAHIDGQGWVHFSVYSPRAKQVSLLLFDNPSATVPARVIPMEKIGVNWKIKIKGAGIGNGLLYMYQAMGPYEISSKKQYGAMFNENYFLNDPFAYKTQNVNYTAFFKSLPYTESKAPVYAGGGKSIVYDHGKDSDPGHVKIAPKDLIVYELHVQDYTARIRGLDPLKRGTYLGLAMSGLKTEGGLSAGIDHLVELGINAVELMPVMEYDEQTGNLKGRYNHWGYMTANFFAPEARYACRSGEQVVEMKRLVRAFHEKKIAVFMDVVYNHTAEQSPWLSKGKLAAKYYNAMGLCNTDFYRSTADGKYYHNNTGTGNDVSFCGGDDTFSKRWVKDSLCLWFRQYGIDGFRFDLARILADGSGSAADWVDNDRRFAAAHLHAEPWDMGGQWWSFMDSGNWNYTNNRWTKWLGRYRDHIRRFSASNMKDEKLFKQLLEGYGADHLGAPASSKPWRSINMLTCHDGYTLRDVTYFNDYDGSHNCWDSNGDENLRREREKSLMGVLLTSQGTPLILQGDEFGRTKSSALTQGDAHNTYNYESTSKNKRIDNVNWIDWRLKDGDNSESPTGPKYGREMFHWTRDLIRLRKKWSHFRRADFPVYTTKKAGSANDGKFSYVWETGKANVPAQLAVVWWGKKGEPDIMVVYNEHWDPFAVTNLSQWSHGDWKILARSWYGDGSDFGDIDNWRNNPNANGSIMVKGRSIAILVSNND